MSSRTVVAEAAREVGLPGDGIELLREGSHSLYRLPGGVVARVGRPRSLSRARHELETARWLRAEGIGVVCPLTGVLQPTLVDDHPVTWWEELPDHRPATPAELGLVLRKVHALAVPDDPSLPALEPFIGLAERIDLANVVSDEERQWLRSYLDRLQEQWATLPYRRPLAVVHGDAWQGNVAVTVDGRIVLLDLDHVSLGPCEWDLVPLAVDHTDFARIDDIDYRSFVGAYSGYDVASWPGYRTVANIAELRWACFALDRARSDPEVDDEARHRVACLRGDVPKPWTWRAL